MSVYGSEHTNHLSLGFKVPFLDVPKVLKKGEALFGGNLEGVSVYTSTGIWMDKQHEDAWSSEMPYLGWRSGWMKTELEGEPAPFYARPDKYARVDVIVYLRVRKDRP